MHRRAARQEQNDDFWSGPDTSHDLPSPSAVLALQAARNCCARLLWKQLQARGKGGVPPGHSQAGEMGLQSHRYAQECYLWCRPCRLICAFLQLHLALPGRAPGLTYHRQGHMSCQPSEGQ